MNEMNDLGYFCLAIYSNKVYDLVTTNYCIIVLPYTLVMCVITLRISLGICDFKIP